MPINSPIKANGFDFILTNIHNKIEIILDTEDPKISAAIINRDEGLFIAFDLIKEISEEYQLVLIAEEHFYQFQQSPGNRKNIFTVFGPLEKIFESRFSSDKLKERILLEFWIEKHPVIKKYCLEWQENMYCVYQNMSEKEQKNLKEWELAYINKSKNNISTYWPGWNHYFDKIENLDGNDRIKKPGNIYLIKAENDEYKIGYSKNLESRLKSIIVNSPIKVSLVHEFYTDDMIKAESLLHEQYSSKKSHGEWYNLNSNDVSDITKIAEYSNNKFIFFDE